MEFESDSELEPLSKTRLKQDATDLQKLGKELTSYSPAFLRKLPIKEVLIAAIAEYNRLPNSFGAKRRQLQFIGKLMRDCDYQLITETIHKLKNGTITKTKKKSEVTAWCDRILQSGDTQIDQLLEQHPHLERQTIRQLQREFNRAKEGSQDKYRKKLQSYLQQQLGN